MKELYTLKYKSLLDGLTSHKEYKIERKGNYQLCVRFLSAVEKYKFGITLSFSSDFDGIVYHGANPLPKLPVSKCYSFREGSALYNELLFTITVKEGSLILKTGVLDNNGKLILKEKCDSKIEELSENRFRIYSNFKEENDFADFIFDIIYLD